MLGIQQYPDGKDAHMSGNFGSQVSQHIARQVHFTNAQACKYSILFYGSGREDRFDLCMCGTIDLRFVCKLDL